MNNSQELVLDERSFYVKCINDYVHFILSFYNLVLKNDKRYTQLIDILFKYFMTGEFEDDLVNSSSLKNFFTKNGNKIKNIDKMEVILKSRNNTTPIKTKRKRSSVNNEFNNNREPTSPRFTIGKRRLLYKNLKLNIESNENKNEKQKATQLFKNLPDFNRLSNFHSIQTSGEQSNMMLSTNGNFFFKTFKPNNSSKRRQFENECRVYLHLKKINPLFLQNSSCFVACYTNGLLLKNGGLSLHDLLEKSYIYDPSILKLDLQNFFQKVLELQLSGVTHNDLHCGNVVGFDRHDLRFIDFGLAKTCEVVLNMDFLVRLNTVFKKIFFYFAGRYQLF
jgi:hypothetical protein